MTAQHPASELALKAFEYEQHRAQRLDDKATNLIALIGVAVGIIVHLVGTVLDLSPPMAPRRFALFAALAALAGLALACAAGCSLLVVRLREYSSFKTEMLEAYAGRPDKDAAHDILLNLLAFTKQDRKTNDDKARYLEWSLILTTVGICSMVVVGFVLLLPVG